MPRSLKKGPFINDRRLLRKVEVRRTPVRRTSSRPGRADRRSPRTCSVTPSPCTTGASTSPCTSPSGWSAPGLGRVRADAHVQGSREGRPEERAARARSWRERQGTLDADEERRGSAGRRPSRSAARAHLADEGAPHGRPRPWPAPRGRRLRAVAARRSHRRRRATRSTRWSRPGVAPRPRRTTSSSAPFATDGVATLSTRGRRSAARPRAQGRAYRIRKRTSPHHD